MIELIKNTATVLYAVALLLLGLALPIAGAVLVMAVFPLLQVLWLVALPVLAIWLVVRHQCKPKSQREAERLRHDHRRMALRVDLRMQLAARGLRDTPANRAALLELLAVTPRVPR
jgi:hypothetical protein